MNKKRSLDPPSAEAVGAEQEEAVRTAEEEEGKKGGKESETFPPHLTASGVCTSAYCCSAAQ